MVAADTQQVLSEAVELVETRISWMATNPRAFGLMSGLVGLTVGATASWWFSRRQMSKKFDESLIEQIAETKKYYATLYKKDEHADLEKMAEAYDSEIDEGGYRSLNKEVVDGVEVIITQDLRDTAPAPVQVNIFRGQEDDWDYAAEKLARESLTDGTPYVIHHDEFMENEFEYDQMSITYYEGDDVLSDEADQPIPNQDVVGVENLLKFGHGSRDVNVVYVRNDTIRSEFEITFSPGKYSKEVMGFIEHSDKRPLRRFRDADE